MNPYKPEGYNSLSPYFVVDGAQKLIDMLIAVFDAEPLRRYDLPNGRIMHAELRIDDTVIMMGDSAEGHPPIILQTHIYVPDVHATFKKALEAGFTAIQEPLQKEGEFDVRGLLTDFQGNIWAVSTQLND